MPEETPAKDDGSFFKHWLVGDKRIAPHEVASLTDDATAVARYYFNATYSFNEHMNITDAGGKSCC